MNRIEELSCYYISLLRSIALVHQNHHWLCKGDNFYGNHLLFERIYKSAAEDSDLAAEKLIGLFSTEALDLHMQAQMIGKTLEDFSSGDPIETSLEAEKKFLTYSQKFYNVLKQEDKMSLGLDDMLMAIASNREGAVYLLQQVKKQGSEEKNERIASRIAMLKQAIGEHKVLDQEIKDLLTVCENYGLMPKDVSVKLFNNFIAKKHNVKDILSIVHNHLNVKEQGIKEAHQLLIELKNSL